MEHIGANSQLVCKHNGFDDCIHVCAEMLSKLL